MPASPEDEIVAETLQGRSETRITQITFFLPNRLGTLRQVVSRLSERGIRLCGIAVQDAADFAVVRIVATDPQGAEDVLRGEGCGMTTTDLLAVGLPKRRNIGIGSVLADLFSAEINVEYVYGLLDRVDGRSVIALKVDAPEMAARILRDRGFSLVGQDDLAWNAEES